MSKLTSELSPMLVSSIKSFTTEGRESVYIVVKDKVATNALFKTPATKTGTIYLGCDLNEAKQAFSIGQSIPDNEAKWGDEAIDKDGVVIPGVYKVEVL